VIPPAEQLRDLAELAFLPLQRHLHWSIAKVGSALPAGIELDDSRSVRLKSVRTGWPSCARPRILAVLPQGNIGIR